MKKENLLWGLLLIILGIIFGLNALEITNINLLFDGWWTLFIIIPSFINLFTEKDKTGNIIGLAIGLSLFLACQDIITFDLIFKLALPFILIVIGLSMIFKDTINKKIKQEIQKLNNNSNKEHFAIFGSQQISFKDEKCESCSLNAIFGGIKYDLKEAIIDEDICINASAVFGGITICVPDNVNVKITSTPIFGGVSDERKDKRKDAKYIIYINAICIFGGVDIK